ncbi:hypothetical protein E1H12_16270 [Geitlerinema sp. P-1104]|uniref:ubiquitin-conjugating enzyme E2 n=1 Tax=Geitlerinema sp. P-1104 TaxID=2546230 RepID=UPI001476F0E5|nr:ubiquitin-conjugating enzyme E2 [Geitlerinema sp. P-1104]NMG60030.1 hypothetical protein [Geitlerinema sp. P-1104]
MSIREDRLANDYKALRSLCVFSQSVKVKILEARGNPPEHYRIQISNCKGIESVNGNMPRYRTDHILLIGDFPERYPDPGELPVAKLETPIFHPNVYSNGKFCFQGKDLNTVNEPLDSLVKRIISMIQYKNRRYGVPANSTAKSWAESHQNLLDQLTSDSDRGSQSRPKPKWK